MKIEGALSHAITGIQRGLNGVQTRAAQIASTEQFNSDSPSGLIDPLVGLKQDRLQVQASTRVLQAVDDMIGSLFDDKA